MFSQQRREIARLASQLAKDRETARHARVELEHKARATLASPAGLLGCFVAGLVVAGTVARLLRPGRGGGALAARGLAAAGTWALRSYRSGQAGVRETAQPTEAPEQPGS